MALGDRAQAQSGATEVEMEAGGLKFTVQAEMKPGDFVVNLTAVLRNLSDKDWRMQSMLMTVTGDCGRGRHQFKFTTSFQPIAPGLNTISAYEPAFRKNGSSCTVYSVGPVKFVGLAPVDDATQASLRAQRQNAIDLEKLTIDLAKLHKEQREKAEVNCHALHEATADRKMSDLTVRETEQVKACQDLGLYRE
jgi:hypothetical protein